MPNARTAADMLEATRNDREPGIAACRLFVFAFIWASTILVTMSQYCGFASTIFLANKSLHS